MKESKPSKWTFIIVGGIIMWIISFTLIYYLLIPDVCYYHFNEMNSFMKLFYSAGGADNRHPSPNSSNAIFSFIIGGILGYVIYKKKTTANTVYN
ncbi:hypothetical protein V6246_18025 [Algibacter sp. TI.3.09]|uniref:hypothetical protein n=1 Tax=Algibacter sp. TI.3.09 TaxID=3121298 RepID=UPI00311E4A0D